MNRLGVGLAAVGLLALSSGWVLGATPSKQTKAENLQLSVRLDAKEVMQFGALRGIVTLRNVSDAPVDVSPGVWSNLKFHSSRGKEPFAICGYGATRGRDVWGQAKPLEPGEALTEDEILFFAHDRPSKFVFAKPGPLRLKARLGVDMGAPWTPERRTVFVESAVVEIAVKPLPADHAEPAEMITNLRVAGFLQMGGGRKEDAKVLEQLVADHPYCLYADNVHYALGQQYAAQRSANSKDVASAKKAQLHFSQVSARVGAMRVRALIRLGELAVSSLDIKPLVDMKKLLAELDGYGIMVERIGWKKRLDDLRKKSEGVKD